MSKQCPFCDSAMNTPFNRCKLGHTYCDDCALVCMIGGDTDSLTAVFCPMCEQPPQEFVCPITHELMDTPVVAQDGFTYEKHAIEGWMCHKKTSPKTNEPIEPVFLPNFNIKTLITEWKLRHCGSSGK